MEDRFDSLQCAALLKALSEPARLRIVDRLFEGPSNVTDLSEAVDLDMMSTSHHLKVLRSAGLVERDKQGRFGIYRLRPGLMGSRAKRSRPPQLDLGCCRIELAPPGDASQAK